MFIETTRYEISMKLNRGRVEDLLNRKMKNKKKKIYIHIYRRNTNASKSRTLVGGLVNHSRAPFFPLKPQDFYLLYTKYMYNLALFFFHPL